MIWFQPPGLDWSLEAVVEQSPVPASIDTDIDGIISSLVAEAKPGTRIVIMSNGGFGGIHQRLIQALEVQCGH